MPRVKKTSAPITLETINKSTAPEELKSMDRTLDNLNSEVKAISERLTAIKGLQKDIPGLRKAIYTRLLELHSEGN